MFFESLRDTKLQVRRIFMNMCSRQGWAAPSYSGSGSDPAPLLKVYVRLRLCWSRSIVGASSAPAPFQLFSNRLRLQIITKHRSLCFISLQSGVTFETRKDGENQWNKPEFSLENVSLDNGFLKLVFSKELTKKTLMFSVRFSIECDHKM